MCVHVCAQRVCVCICVHSVYVCMCVHRCLRVCMCVHVCAQGVCVCIGCVYMCVHRYLHVCRVYVCTCVCTGVCVCAQRVCAQVYVCAHCESGYMHIRACCAHGYARVCMRVCAWVCARMGVHGCVRAWCVHRCARLCCFLDISSSLKDRKFPKTTSRSIPPSLNARQHTRVVSPAALWSTSLSRSSGFAESRCCRPGKGHSRVRKNHFPAHAQSWFSLLKTTWFQQFADQGALTVFSSRFPD